MMVKPSFNYLPDQTDSLIKAMLELNEDRFEKVISTSSLKYGFEQTMLNILIPFLQKVGIMWRVGESNVFQEHFITNLIRKKILVAVDAYSGNTTPGADEYLLYLPDGELHEIGLLFSKYILKVRGKRVIYLGQMVPIADVISYCEKYNPKYHSSKIDEYKKAYKCCLERSQNYIF